MRQHPIDLMPASIRARSQAGVRAGRFVGAAVIILAVTVVVATHSRLRLTGAQERLEVTKAQAEMVFAVDAKAAELEATLKGMREFIQRYEQVALPVPLSAVVATLINALPESVTLDQIDMDAGSRATSARSPRSRGTEPRGDGGAAVPRVLRCEISGFAASDEHIALLVNRLERTAPFQHVNLDFSRTRKVNGRDAREFRMSFRIDLNAPYQVVLHDPAAGASQGDLANAQ